MSRNGFGNSPATVFGSNKCEPGKYCKLGSCPSKVVGGTRISSVLMVFPIGSVSFLTGLTAPVRVVLPLLLDPAPLLSSSLDNVMTDGAGEFFLGCAASGFTLTFPFIIDCAR